MGLTANIPGKELLDDLFSNGKIHGLSPRCSGPSLWARSMGTRCTLAIGLWICVHDLMKQKGMQSSNLHHPIGDRWLGSSGGARWWLAQHARWLQGQLARVEPTARSGGSLTMRSTPTRSMEDRGSHHGLRVRHRGQAWAGDEEPDTRKNIKVEGVGACVSPLASVPLLAASVAAPLPHRPSERDRGIARR
jgi:hypothetical protein